jgi:hypothetical protein
VPVHLRKHWEKGKAFLLGLIYVTSRLNMFRKIFLPFSLNFNIHVGRAALGRNFGVNIVNVILGRKY